MLGCLIALRKVLLLESSHDSHCSGVSELEEGRVQDFGSTWEIITLGLVDSPIGASAQRLGFDELDVLVSKLSLDLLGHC